MKKRKGFVSNSSSSSFIITNKTDKDLTFVDFVNENPHMVVDFVDYYDWYDYTFEDFLGSANSNDTIIPANSSDEYEFSDNGGDVLENVLHTVLVNCGESESFKWGGHESHH